MTAAEDETQSGKVLGLLKQLADSGEINQARPCGLAAMPKYLPMRRQLASRQPFPGLLHEFLCPMPSARLAAVGGFPPRLCLIATPVGPSSKAACLAASFVAPMQTQMAKGFGRVEARLEDISLDLPRAPQLLAQFKQQAQEAGWLSA